MKITFGFQESIWALIFLCIVKADAEVETKEDLVQAESKDGTLEIIKQIKKVNNDGSYTVGYEADDGSFKIESRDVLGNIKGTYGYVDDSGKIKRVSYSSSNSSEIIHKVESDSVVQRIPKNKTIISTTDRPYYSASTSPTPSRRKHLVSSTTMNPELEETKSSTRLAYASSTPRNRFVLKSNEGQLPRPEDVDVPTVIPLDTKPVTEEPELKSNILRRQLPRDGEYDAQQHVYQIQQSVGADSPDVYSAPMNTRPLFTTTNRPIRLSSTTAAPIRRPTVRYPKNLQVEAQHKDEPETDANEESVATPTSVPIVQIPANREGLVAIRHPYQREAVLVPLSHLQRRLVPFASPRDINDNIQGYENYNPEPSPKPDYNRRQPPPPLPVQVDENGYIHPNIQKLYAVPVPVTPRYLPEPAARGIEHIQPPVSVRDFQIILQQLELRQRRLERLHELTNPERFQEIIQRRPNPYQLHRFGGPTPNPNGPVQFVPAQSRRHYQTIDSRQLSYQDPRDQYEGEQYTPSYTPSKRMANDKENEDYLPADIREMLLLKMLQLAINPALPDNEESDTKTSTVSYFKKDPSRNVEILGEDREITRRPPRVKRFKDDLDYVE